MLLMATHPEIQSKAQAELDEVVGTDRLPLLEDRPNLPYIENIIKEVHRFHPVAPMLLHTPTNDDTYNGFFIPKGTSIFANLWYQTVFLLKFLELTLFAGP
jgi:cytochrome P450